MVGDGRVVGERGRGVGGNELDNSPTCDISPAALAKDISYDEKRC